MKVTGIHRFAGLALFAAHVVAAQSGNPPAAAPPGAEESLRARVTEFYELQRQGKFRASESCVCEDTRDYYYDLGKKSPRSFKIAKVDFAEGFQSAIVQLTVSAEVAMIGGTFTVDAPVPTQWKLENGKWCFYLTKEQQTATQTPFGKFPVPERGQPTASPAQGGQTAFRPVTVAEVMGGVKSTADTVIFDATRAAAAEIQFTNSLPGRVEVSIAGLLPPGISVKLSGTEILSKQSATARFSYAPTPGSIPPLSEYVIKFQFEPTRQILPITIRFEHPAAPKPKTEFPPPSAPKQ